MNELSRVRTALVAAVALIDRLQNPRVLPIDRQVLELLAQFPEGLTGRAICLLVRRRRQDTVAAVRLLAAAKHIERVRGRWKVTDAQEI